MLRSARNYDRNEVSVETGLFCDPDENKTQQQFKEDADINVIVRRFGVTGQAVVTPKIPLQAEFAEVVDFHTAANLMRRASEEFMRLPSELRTRFGNDPGALVDFVSNGDNREEAIRLGLIPKPAEVDRAGGAVPPGVKPE